MVEVSVLGPLPFSKDVGCRVEDSRLGLSNMYGFRMMASSPLN